MMKRYGRIAILLIALGVFIFGVLPSWNWLRCAATHIVRAESLNACSMICTWWVPKPCSGYNDFGNYVSCSILGVDQSGQPCTGCCFAHSTVCTPDPTDPPPPPTATPTRTPVPTNTPTPIPTNTPTPTPNPPTVSGSLSCTMPGNNGWCRAGRLNVTGYVVGGGYTIDRIEGNFDGSNNATVSCPGSSCSFIPPEGTGTFWYWAVSSYGVASSKGSTNFKMDTVRPTVVSQIPAPDGQNGWHVTPVQINPQASDATSGIASLQINTGSGWQTGAQTLTDGMYTVQIRAEDQAGNITLITQQVNVDTTAPDLVPQITPSTPDGSGGWYVSSVSLNATATDATSGVRVIHAQINGGAWQNLPVTLDQDGTYTVTFEAVDQAGNTTRETRTISVDRTPPAISTLIPTPDGLNNWYVSEPQIDGTATDSTSGVSVFHVSVNNGAWQALPVTLPEGVHTVVFEAADRAGNVSTRSATISVDTTAPTGQTVLEGIPGDNGWWRSPVQVTLQTSDAASGVIRAEISDDGGQTWQSSLTLPEGVHDLQVVIQDNAGWETFTRTRVMVDVTAPAGTIETDNSGKLSSTVTLSGTLSDVTSGLVSAEVSTDGGETWNAVYPVSGQSNPLSTSPWSFEWDTTRNPGGNNTVVLRVRDQAGNTYQTEKTFFVSNALPSVGFDANSWYVWQSSGLFVARGDLPVIRVCLRVEDPKNRWKAWEQCWNSIDDVPKTFAWNRRFGDGTLAPVGEYRAVLSATDLLLRTVEAVGTIVIPPAPTPTATSTPLATLATTPTTTPTMTATATATATPEPTHTAVVVRPTRTETVPVPMKVTGKAEKKPSMWAFMTLIGLMIALTLTFLQDERPQEVHKMAKRIELILNLRKEK